MSKIAQMFLLSLVLVWGASPVPAAEPKRGGLLQLGVSKNFSTLNPFRRMQSVDYRIRSLMYEGLLALDKDLGSLPTLATSWEVSADGLTYTFTLRQGVKFHNGKSLSPSDVKWSIEYAQNPKNQAWGRADLTIVERVETVEPNGLRIQLKSPYAPFLSAISGIHWFPVVPKDSLETGEARPERYPPGTGPFRYLSLKEGQEIRVGRFEDYWQKGLPYLDEVRFVVIVDDTVRGTAVRAGDLDVAEEIPDEMTIRIRNGKIPGIKVILAEAGGLRRMGINHCKPPFNDVKVRQAFIHALDKQEIINGAFGGLGFPTNQKIFKGTKWFISEVPDRKHDVERAKKLLAEAGYPNGLKVTLAAWRGTEKVVQVIQSQVKQAGIDVDLLIRDFPTHIAALRKAEYQISYSGGSTNSDPDLAYYGYYHTPPPNRRHLGGRTQPCYSNPRVDKLLEDARKTNNFQERRSMYKEVIEILQEDATDITLAFTPNGYAIGEHVRDFVPTITSTFSYGNGGLLRTWMDK